jgi:hypothetical protein
MPHSNKNSCSNETISTYKIDMSKTQEMRELGFLRLTVNTMLLFHSTTHLDRERIERERERERRERERERRKKKKKKK